MWYGVLGPLEIRTDDGRLLVPKGRVQRLLVSALVLHAPRVAPVDRLVDIVWGDRPPANPAGALQTQISRLRALLRSGEASSDPIRSEPYGYRLVASDGELDAARFATLVSESRQAGTLEAMLDALDRALALWRGEPYEEFATLQAFVAASTRLAALRAGALERRVELLLALGRAGDALAAAEPLALEHPLRERPTALLMEALLRVGRQSEALAAFQEFRRRLADELGLEPSPALRQLELEIIQHARAPAREPLAAHPRTAASDAPALRLSFVAGPDGSRLAVGEAGEGPPLVVPPAWISSLAALGSGADPRSAFLGHLAARFRVIAYDRYGMGLSSGSADAVSLDRDVRELQCVLDGMGIDRTALLAVSQAGPVALTLAARDPARVVRLVLIGTYASAPRAFTRPDLRRSMVALVRAHWGIGSRVLADLIIPGATTEEQAAFARVQRQSASPELAALTLEQFFIADVTELLPRVRCPALVLHYRRDRAIPFRAGEEMAALLPEARFVPLDGEAHLPQPADLDQITRIVHEFVDA